MATYTITLEDTGETFRAREDVTVLEAMEGMGRHCIDVGCRFGGCGVCRIEILAGSWTVHRPMSRAHVSEEDERAGRVLACRIRATGDLRIRRPASYREPGRSVGEGGAGPPKDHEEGDVRWR
jgi:ferredoxin